MKKNFFYIAALALIATACTNEDALVTVPADNNVTSDVKMITETITATNGDASGTTRVTIDNSGDAKTNFAWTAGDNIAVHVSDGTNHKYVFTSDAGASGASESAAEASFTVAYEEGYSRDAFAVYPATIVAADATNYGDGSALDVTLPGSYTLAQVSGTTTPCPMIATNTPGKGWTFYQLCGMIRLTINGIPADATGLKIQFPDNKVNGDFALASPVTPGTSIISTTDITTDGEDKITVTDLGGVTSATINIPLPTGDYKYVYVTSVGGTTKMAALQKIKEGGYTAERAHAKKLTTTMALLPEVTRSDGGEEDELYPDYDGQYLFAASSNPAKVTISGDCTGYYFEFEGSAEVTLTGNGTATSTYDLQDFIFAQNGDLTIALGSDYTINCKSYETAICCQRGTLKFRTTTSTAQTLTITTNEDDDYKGIYGYNNDDFYYYDIVNDLAADGFTVTRSATTENSDGTFTRTYTVEPSYKIKFTYNNGTEPTELTNVRFVRIFSSQNKLHNGETTYGPFTMSSDTDNLPNPITPDLTFDDNDGDQLVFQVITADGKVYSGSCDVPNGGFIIGKSYDLTVPVNLYKFTISAPGATTIKKAYISPGDLGIDNNVYSFTEPFTNWGYGTNKQTDEAWSKRVWFDFGTTASCPVTVYGIEGWRVGSKFSGSTSYEWNYIFTRTNMVTGVAPYYKVTIEGHGCCLLLPPDETKSSDIGTDLTSGTVTDYVRYLGKGFVLLMSAGRATFKNNYVSNAMVWEKTSEGWYWASNYQSNRTYFSWTDSNDPACDNAYTTNLRMHARLFLDVN